VGTTSSGVVGLAATVFTLASAFLSVFLAAGLVAAADFGLGFLGPAVFLVAVTLGCEGAYVTGLGVGLGFGVEVVVALTTGPPRTTWFQPSPKSVCSAECPARWALGAADWLVAAFLWTPGARFARAAFASFHLIQPL